MIASSSPERKPMEITFKRPEPTTRSKGIIFPECAWMAPSIASSLGTEWPQTSASSRPTTRPRRASETARFTLTEDLPTPPLPEATASTLAVAGMSVGTALSWALSRALAMSADRSEGSITPVLTSTSSTPGTALR